MASPAAAQPYHWNYTNPLDGQDSAVHGHGIVFLLTVLCILLLFTLLYLYFRWACYSHRLSTSAATTTTVTSTTEGANHASVGLDASTINSIPVELHGEGEKEECVICLGMFTQGEKVKVLPSCRHGFHPECIDGWLRTQPSCPICRASVVKKTATDVKDMV